MAKYCTNLGKKNVFDRAETEQDPPKQTLVYAKSSKPTVKQCLTEYSLEDKVQALKNVFEHNERHTRDSPSNTRIFDRNDCAIKRSIDSTVKECLEGKRKTPFETLISELKDTVMNSYWHKQVGKTRYQVPNLPTGMDPIGTTFGRKLESGVSMGELINPEITQAEYDNETYKNRKTRDNDEPSVQTNREYKKPFDKHTRFGKIRDINFEGARAKKLLTWINSDPIAMVTTMQADFLKRTQPRVGETKNIENARLYAHTVHGKQSKEEIYGAAKALNDCPISDEAILQQKYLQHLNTLRLRLKNRVPEIPFLDIFQELLSLDKEYTDLLPQDKVFAVLAKYKIYTDNTVFIPLLDIFEIRKSKDVYYRALLNLLNWKYDIPTLPKIDKIPLECQYYKTTYDETIGSTNVTDITNVPIAGVPSRKWKLSNSLDTKYLEIENSAYAAIFPDIFAKYGLTHTDFHKARNKEEIRSIFEDIGVEFPDDSFDLLWEKGLKMDGTGGVSINTFNILVDKPDVIINNSK